MNRLLNCRDIDFILYEFLDVESLTQRRRSAEHSRGTFDAALDIAASKSFSHRGHGGHKGKQRPSRQERQVRWI